MRDLQELLETMSVSDFIQLVEMFDKKSLNNKSVEKVLDYISIVYCIEKDIGSAEISKHEMNVLFNSFSTCIILYANVVKGDMEIVRGRLMLTDDSSCDFSLTPQGIRSVENMIGK